MRAVCDDISLPFAISGRRRHYLPVSTGIGWLFRIAFASSICDLFMTTSRCLIVSAQQALPVAVSKIRGKKQEVEDWRGLSNH
ncbi:MAG: hypothetical protein A2W80_09560 [Candidatus Riflebacteria bacterium GWC2_50_8]|nr:MAG: hypothetical protein A2W80_09560 [Candidatus Riflebacteria bacterium GWC2_50_8]